jgi:hypothetical protein
MTSSRLPLPWSLLQKPISRLPLPPGVCRKSLLAGFLSPWSLSQKPISRLPLPPGEILCFMSSYFKFFRIIILLLCEQTESDPYQLSGNGHIGLGRGVAAFQQACVISFQITARGTHCRIM